jgi:hypothetical protein
MNINGRHFHVCHSFGISSTGSRWLEIVRFSHFKTMMLTSRFGAISRRKLQGRVWGTRLKRQTEKEGEERQTFTWCELKIQRKENKKPV